MKTIPRWIENKLAIAIFECVQSRHHGSAAIRDQSALGRALARPKRWLLNRETDMMLLAASYATAICDEKPFEHGNKRVALIVSATFLEMNGFHFSAPESEAVVQMLALAAGEVDEQSFAEWLRKNSSPR